MNWILENLSLFWLALTIFFLVLEGMTYGLVTIWFAGGSAVAILVSFFVHSVVVQGVVFLLVSLILLILTRPLVRKKIDPKIVATNADALIGEIAYVTKVTDEFNTGQAKVNGQIWTIQTLVNEPIHPGQRVLIKDIDGVKLMVTPIEEKKEN